MRKCLSHVSASYIKSIEQMLPALPAGPECAPAGVVYLYDENSVLAGSKVGVYFCGSKLYPACEAPEELLKAVAKITLGCCVKHLEHLVITSCIWLVVNKTPPRSVMTSFMPVVCSSLIESSDSWQTQPLSLISEVFY